MRRLLFAGSVLALALKSASAAACSIPPPTLTVLPPPADGLLVVDVSCFVGACLEDPAPASVTVTDLTTQQTIAGTVERVEEEAAEAIRLAWRPSTPFVAGRSYQLDWNPLGHIQFADSTRTFIAQAATGWTLANLAHSIELFRLEESSEQVSCEARFQDSCGGNTAVVTLEVRSVVNASVYVSPEAEPQGAQRQYTLRAALWRDGDAEPALGEAVWQGPMAQGRFETAADKYCYRIELENLIDGATEQRTGCIDHGDLGDLSVTTTGEEQLTQQLTQCVAAPAGLEALWCQAMREACAQPGAATDPSLNCATLAESCAGVEVGGSGGVGGTGAAGAGAGGGGAGDGSGAGMGGVGFDDAMYEDPNKPNASDSDSDDSGGWLCTVGRAAPVKSSPIAALALLLGLARIATRRARRR